MDLIYLIFSHALHFTIQTYGGAISGEILWNIMSDKLLNYESR